MRKVYSIFKYNLTGEILFSYELLGEFENDNIKVDNNKIKVIYPNGDTRVDVVKKPNHIRYFSFTPKGVSKEDIKYLPYFADVTEDLPSSMKENKPITYENCQLMTETHGAYLQFYHAKTNKVLRIAINSNIYEPILN